LQKRTVKNVALRVAFLYFPSSISEGLKQSQYELIVTSPTSELHTTHITSYVYEYHIGNM